MAPGRGTLAAAPAVAGAGVLRCGDEKASQAAGAADDAAAIAATINEAREAFAVGTGRRPVRS